jgi:hypothetical protein
VSDAKSVRKRLREQHDFSTFKHLYNKDATLDKIRKVLVDELGKDVLRHRRSGHHQRRDKINKGDQLLIFLAGHGDAHGFLCYDYSKQEAELDRANSVRAPSGGARSVGVHDRSAKKNIAPPSIRLPAAAENASASPSSAASANVQNANQRRLEEAERKARDARIKRISYKHLFKDIVEASGVPADQILFIIDACHAGESGGHRVIVKHRERNQSLNTTGGSTEPPALHAMGSCAGDELAIEVEEKGKMQGLFTKCFLQAIDTEAKYEDGLVAFEPGNFEVTARQVFMKIGDRVALEARRRGTGREQNPQFGSIIGTEKEWHGRRAQGQFMFWRSSKSAKAHMEKEKDSVKRMRRCCEKKRAVDSWTDSMVRLHEVLGSFRYHHCLDILSASYQGKGLPLTLVCDVLNMLPRHFIDLVKWHQKDCARAIPARKYQIVEILASQKHTERAVSEDEEWEELRARTKKEKGNANAWVRLVKKPARSENESFEEWCFRHTEDQMHEQCPKSWENPDCCGSLLPKEAAGHAVLGSRCTLGDKAYLPVARRWHNTKRVSHLMPKSMRDGLSRGVLDIVGSTGTKIRLMWAFFQCLAYIPIVFEVPWPGFMVDLSSRIRELTSEILVSLFGWHCSLQADFLAIFGAHMACIPLLVLTAFLADQCARSKRMANKCGYEAQSRRKKKKKKKKDGESRRKSKRRCATCLSLMSAAGERFWWTVEDVILDKLYNPVCTQLFWFFRCKQIQDMDFLLSDMRVKCWQGAHLSMAPVAFLCIVALMFGIPLLQLFYMWRYRDYLHSANIDLSDRIPVQDRRKARERHRRVKKRIGALYEQYTDDCYWVNILEKLHTLLISGGVVILGPSSVARCLMAILVSALWILFLVYKTPYRAAWDNLLASILAIELILTLVLGLAANSSGAEIMTISALNSTSSAGKSFEENAQGFFIGVTNVVVIFVGVFAIIGSLPFLRQRILSQYSIVSKWVKKVKKAVFSATGKLAEMCGAAHGCSSFDPTTNSKKGKKQTQVIPGGTQLWRDAMPPQTDDHLLLDHEIKEIAENLQIDLEPSQVDTVIKHIVESLNSEQRETLVGSFGGRVSSAAGQSEEMREMRERLEADHAAALAEKDSALAEHATALAKEKSRCHALAEEQKHALAELAAARKRAHAATNSHDNSTHDDVAKVAEKIFEGSTQHSKSFKQHQLEKHAGEGKDDDAPAPPPGPPPISPPVIA